MKGNDELRIAHDAGDMVRVSEIRWTLEPLRAIEDTDLLTLTSGELLAYAADLQAEARALRTLLYDGLTMVARQRDQLQRAARLVDQQRIELRRRCQDAAA